MDDKQVTYKLVDEDSFIKEYLTNIDILKLNGSNLFTGFIDSRSNLVIVLENDEYVVLKSELDSFFELVQEPVRASYTQIMKDHKLMPDIHMNYLDEDGQLCTCVGRIDDIVIGHQYEHPCIDDYPNISSSRLSDIHPVPEKKSGEELQLEKLVDKYVDKFFAFSDPRMAAEMIFGDMQKNGDLPESF